MSDLTGVKAGDKLYVRRGYHDVGRIETVDRVTPSGRVVVRYDTYETNGRLRGRGGAWIATTAERATQEHIDKVAHAELAGELSRYAKWDEHSLATLRSVKAILATANAMAPKSVPSVDQSQTRGASSKKPSPPQTC